MILIITEAENNKGNSIDSFIIPNFKAPTGSTRAFLTIVFCFLLPAGQTSRFVVIVCFFQIPN